MCLTALPITYVARPTTPKMAKIGIASRAASGMDLLNFIIYPKW